MTICYFCNKHEAEGDKSYEVKMHRYESGKGMYTTFGYISKALYTPKTVNIPRCSKCELARDRATYALLGITLLGLFGVPLYGFLELKLPFDLYSLGLLAMLGLFIGISIGEVVGIIILLVSGTKVFSGVESKAIKNYVDVKSSLADGFKIGDVPKGKKVKPGSSDAIVFNALDAKYSGKEPEVMSTDTREILGYILNELKSGKEPLLSDVSTKFKMQPDALYRKLIRHHVIPIETIKGGVAGKYFNTAMRNRLEEILN